MKDLDAYHCRAVLCDANAMMGDRLWDVHVGYLDEEPPVCLKHHNVEC